ncbi:hypothetical protein LUZ61_007772 [Rhynchospora tenuis]|uniref:Reverse transcriptase Ty1/copia-type domain-containing protein n=1 Tax=Rhynchospora tenuis TaxID=198213 RepID=A0AAD6EWT2_9POAL|nr:hypothetical protein LUZ61_007772 [Rhynchospora tenuis]
MADPNNKTTDTKVVVAKAIDLNSPFYLSPSNSPGMMISSCVLKGENYDLWVKAMRNALRAKNKLGFVDGSVSKPKDNTVEAAVWGSCNSILVSWLFNCIDPTLQPSVAYFETVKELWDDLKDRFSIGDVPRIHQLKADLAGAKQQGLPVAEYYTRLKTLWDELSSYVSAPACVCGGCTCNLTAKFIKEKEEERIHQFLMGLDEGFSSIRTTLLSMDPLPSLNRIYSMVIQEERHKTVTRGREERGDAVSFAVQLNKTEPSQSKTGEKPTCTHCNKIGHEIANYFELIGYPEGWGRGRRGGRGGRGSGRGRGRGRAQAFNVQSGSNFAQEGGMSSSSNSLAGLSEAQVQQIKAILANTSSANAGSSTEKLHGLQYEDVDWCGARKCVFVGYPFGKRGWRVFDLETNEYVISRDVMFVEHVFPFKQANESATGADVSTNRRVREGINNVLDIADYEHESNKGDDGIEVRGSIDEMVEGDDVLNEQVEIFEHAVHDNSNERQNTDTSMVITMPQEETRAPSTRMRQPPAKLRDYICYTAHVDPLYAHPTSVSSSDGTIERYKARLVVLGNRQVEGIDFNETFAPVVKMTTVRVVLAVAVARGWEMHQMDVHNAFLHGNLHEEVYMRMPPGFGASHPAKVCRLKKSLYGLRQAPRMWFSKLTAALENYGFAQSRADYSLFVYNKGDVFLTVLVYVDDLVIAGNNHDAINHFKKYLCATFHMKDLGQLKYFLGIEIARGPVGLYLSQRKYTLDIIAECGLLGAKPAMTPLEQNHNLGKATGDQMKDPEKYRRLVGKLIYLTITRPELCYAVHTLAQFMHTPIQTHYDAALRVVRYLKKNPGQGIVLRAVSDLQLYGYCDSDWASCPITRRSLTGYFVLLGDSPISWKTKKQHTVSRSSAEAEYRSMASLTCELTWLKSVLSFLGVTHVQPMKTFCDSQASLHIAANPVFHERTKHIEVDCHLVRDKIREGKIVTCHTKSTEQLADIFTKALGKHQFDHLTCKLGICDLHAPT